MSRLLRRALLLLAAYSTVLVVIIIAGFLGASVGIWASVLWIAGIIAGLAIYIRLRQKTSRAA